MADWPLSAPYVQLDAAFAASPYSVPVGANLMLTASADVAADFTANLPPATGSGYTVIVAKGDSNAHAIVVHPNGSDTINGLNADVAINDQFDDVRLVDKAAGVWRTW